MDYTKRTEDGINKYLKHSGQTIQDILGNTDAFVFGGAVRDSITGVDISDVDIIGFSKSTNDIASYLKSCDFIEVETSKLNALYEGIHLFKPPKTYTSNGCIIQLISLNLGHPLLGLTGVSDFQAVKNDKDFMLRCYNALPTVIRNVDINICAVSYHPHTGTAELLPGVFKDIENKRFSVLDDGLMHQPSRIALRVEKMVMKGYSNLDVKTTPAPTRKARYNAWEVL